MPPDLHNQIKAQIENWSPTIERYLPNDQMKAIGLLLGICGVCFCVVLVFSLLRRTIAGASPFRLLAGGAYEWVPFRGILVTIYGLFCLAQFGLTLMLLMFALAFACSFIEKPDERWNAPPAPLVIAGVVAFLLVRAIRLSMRKRVIYVAAPAPPKVKVSVGAISHLRDAGETYWIGTERFPNACSPYFRLGIYTRRLLLLVGVIALFAQVLVAVGPEPFYKHESEFAKSVAPYIEQMRAVYLDGVQHIRDEHFPRPVACSFAYFAFVLLWILLRNNREYLVMRFVTSFVLTVFLTATIWLSMAGLGPVMEQNLSIPFGTGIILLGMVNLRLFRDLRLAAKHKRRQRLFRPIRETISRATSGFLSQVQSDPTCRLPDLNKQDLSERITRGAHNIEEGDAFVTRFFGRYMRVANVATERCTTAAMRFLTINRFTILGGGWPSYAPLSSPSVPVWNQTLFPIEAPKRFANRRDELGLSDRWNCVVYCPPTEQKEETYTDYETRYEWDSASNSNVSRTVMVTKSRYVTVTCSRCGGTGRMEHQQILVTTWQAHCPNEVSPAMSLPELVEGAEEELYFQLPLSDEMQRLPSCIASVDVAPKLAEKMAKAAEVVTRDYEKHAQAILKASGDAFIYRSDFIIAGLHAMNVRFSHLRSRTGWFFGHRPEFHFPKLPLGWATLGTWLFLPPITISLWLAAIGLMAGIGAELQNELKPRAMKSYSQDSSRIQE